MDMLKVFSLSPYDGYIKYKMISCFGFFKTKLIRFGKFGEKLLNLTLLSIYDYVTGNFFSFLAVISLFFQIFFSII